MIRLRVNRFGTHIMHLRSMAWLPKGDGRVWKERRRKKKGKKIVN